MLATFSVSNLNDAGLGSLRQAMLDANNQAGDDTITFESGVFSSSQTIKLVSALPTIVDNLTITGPGQKLLTLDAGHGNDNLPGTGDGHRLLDIDDGNSGNMLSVALSGLTLTGGDVSGAGGAIQSREHLSITDLAIVANATGPGTNGSDGAAGQNGGSGGRGGDGGGIFSSGGNLTIVGSTISGNSTGQGGNGGSGGDGADDTNGQAGGDGGNGSNGGYGGGIFTDGGQLVISNSTISGNSTGAGGAGGSAGDGGASNSTGSDGLGGMGGDGGYGGHGGGVYSSVGEITITGSTISGNSTGVGAAGASGGEGGGFEGIGGDGGDGGYGGSGGGMYSVEGQLELSMSTVTNNLASSGGLGGDGGFGGSSGSNGTDGNGGGIDSLGNDPLLINNSIIAGNQAAGFSDDLKTGAVTLNIDYSLISDADGLAITSGTGNLFGTGLMPISPQLAPLASNGGPTQTHALLPGSPAIDAGDPSIVFNAGEFDQRGAPFVRVEDGNLIAGTTIDIGAYEAQAPASADFDQDNDIDGSDFLAWQRGFGTTAGALISDGNADDDGDVDASDLAVWSATYGQVPAPLAAQQATSTTAVTAKSVVASSDNAPALALTKAAPVSLRSDENKNTSNQQTLLPQPINAESFAAAFAALVSSEPSRANQTSITSQSELPDDQASEESLDLELRDQLLSQLF